MSWISVESADARSIYEWVGFGAIVMVSLYETDLLLLLLFVSWSKLCGWFVRCFLSCLIKEFFNVSLIALSQSERKEPGFRSTAAHFRNTGIRSGLILSQLRARGLVFMSQDGKSSCNHTQWAASFNIWRDWCDTKHLRQCGTYERHATQIEQDYE